MGETGVRIGSTASPGGIPRNRALALTARLRPGAIVLVAPGGYGKSVLAAQIASQIPARVGTWVSLAGRRLDLGCVRSILEGMLERGSMNAQGGESALMPPAGLPDVLAIIDELAAQVLSGPACLVLDDVGPSVHPDAADAVRRLMSRANPESLLVVTSRDPGVRVLAGPDALVLGAADLAFTEDEARDAITAVLARPVDYSVVRDIWSAGSGQPAIVNVLAKHLSLRGGVWEPEEAASLGVSALLRDLAAEQLTTRQAQGLRAIAWLGQGELEDVIQVTARPFSPADLETVAAAVPLIRVGGPGLRRLGFRAHRIVQDVFTEEPRSQHEREEYARAVSLLAKRTDFTRSCELLLRSGTPDDAASWLEEHGASAIHAGLSSEIEQVIDRVPPWIAVSRTKIMLLRAGLTHDSGRLEEAYRWAAAAKDVALVDGDVESSLRASIQLARLQIELGDHILAARHLEELLSENGAYADTETRALATAYLAMSSAALGDPVTTETYRRSGLTILSKSGIAVAVEARARAALCLAGMVLSGRWSEGTPELRTLADRSGAPVAFRVEARANLAFCLMETGRTAAALKHAAIAARASERYGIRCLIASTSGTAACAHAAAGEHVEADRAITDALEIAAALDALGGLSEGLVARSVIRRAEGQHSAALEDAEAAGALSGRMSFRVSSYAAHLERAASLLALGDVAVAVRDAQRIHDVVAPIGAMYLHLKADLVLAEADCRAGDSGAAVARMTEHADYIATESANWMIAMYVRAFPRLLGIVAKAIGVAELPSHMLSMILPAYAEPAVAAAAGVLDARPLAALSQRMLGRKGSGRRISDLPREDVCKVTLFGGLEVMTAAGPVPAKAWRKRKARLLFAMLAVRRGGDVPTDQILDYLWPEFPEEKALNNMYVVWSAMKHALSPELPRGEQCPYVERVGRMCHLVRANVTTDLDAFEDKLAEGRKADHTGDADVAIGAYREVMDIYRGELLPGDAYDDWFRTARDRCKHEYSDAALRLSALLDARGDVPEALQVLRQALIHDPWREDLYQSILRHQISEGQRSAAIETYLNCRSRLTEDLGIDPSAETNKLYQHVLAMESPDGETEWGAIERSMNEYGMISEEGPAW